MRGRLRHPLVVVVAGIALAFPALASAGGGPRVVDRGVVQSVGATQIVLRALDGSLETIPLSSSTQVKINGVGGSIADIEPGFVVAVVHAGAKPAVQIRALGRILPAVDRGMVTALSATAITLRTADGTTLTLTLDGKTRFRFRGRPARPVVARPGAVVTVKHLGVAPATLVNVLKRARA